MKQTTDESTVWYHGSDKSFEVLRAGSTVTPWREMAEAFSHKPPMLSVEDDGSIHHNGRAHGLLYVVDESVEVGRDLHAHPRSTLPENAEFLTDRPLRVRLLCDLGTPEKGR